MQKMTIKELIEHLQQYPQDLPVKIVKTYPDERDEGNTYDEREEIEKTDILQTSDAVIIGEAV